MFLMRVVFLSPHFCCLFGFVSMCQLDLVYIPNSCFSQTTSGKDFKLLETNFCLQTDWIQSSIPQTIFHRYGEKFSNTVGQLLYLEASCYYQSFSGPQKLHTMEESIFQGWITVFPPGKNHLDSRIEICLTFPLQCEERLSIENWVFPFLDLTPDPSTLVSAHTAQIYSVLPFLEH